MPTCKPVVRMGKPFARMMALTALDAFLASAEPRRSGFARELLQKLGSELPADLPLEQLEPALDRFVLRHPQPRARLVCQRLLNWVRRQRQPRFLPRLCSRPEWSRLRQRPTVIRRGPDPLSR